jgi:N-acetylneuraminic acid mutarotase
LKKPLMLLLLTASMLIMSFLTIHHVDALNGDWVKRAAMPTGRYNFGAAAVNGTIYAIGGVTNIPERKSGHITTTIDTNEAYNPTTNIWVEKAPMPSPHWLDNYGIAVWQDKIYCIGGPANNVYDPATDTWESKTPMPTPRHFLQANSVDDEIYLIGGLALGPAPEWQAKLTNEPSARLITYTPSNLTEAYKPATDSWTEKSPMPIAIDSYASVAIDDKIYVISGRIGGDVVSCVQVYDTQTDSWSQAAPIPTPVQAAAAGVTAASGTKAVIVVGGSTRPDGGASTNLCQVFYPENNSWTTIAPMPTSRFALSVSVVNETLYAIGGMGDRGSTGDTYQYTPVNSETNFASSPDSDNPAQQPQPTIPLPEAIATIGIAAATGTSIALCFRRKENKTS